MRLACLLVTAALLAGAGKASAQQPDTVLTDTTAHELPPIEVVGSIRPAAGPTIGSGVPARVTTLSADQVDAYEPRILSDAIKSVAGFSTYDDLGSPYKLNISSRGFEPRLTESNPAVLPLDDPPPIPHVDLQWRPCKEQKPELHCPSSRSFARLARCCDMFGRLEAR